MTTDLQVAPVAPTVLSIRWPWAVRGALTKAIQQAKAEGVPVIIITGPIIVQQAEGGGAKCIGIGDDNYQHHNHG